ncbi:MAG: aldehyde reductase [Bacteroidota bacterium]
MEKTTNNRVLVTGGTGFLGSHCILQLLRQGYSVRTTIRSLNKKDKVIQMMEGVKANNLERLSFVEADLGKDDRWAEATKDCDYVLHVASPFPFSQPKNADEVIKPAVEGALRVLKAASKSGVKRLVLTSSFGAVGYTHKSENLPITEGDWTNTNDKTMTPYILSKTFAEKAAWEFIENDISNMELAVICPRLILGPLLGDNLSTSVKAVQGIFNGSMKGYPNVSYGIIDVRDVADLHIRAMRYPKAAGERFLASSGEPMTFKDMALLMKKKLGEKGNRISTKVYPNWLVRIVALFNPAVKNIVHQLGKTFVTDNSKPTRLLGWEPRTREEAVLATMESLQKMETS